MVINIKKVVDADISELLKLAYSLDAKAVQDAFAKVGISVENEIDIEALARLHQTGGDVAGTLKDKLGRPIKFDVEKILSSAESHFGNNFQQKQFQLKWE